MKLYYTPGVCSLAVHIAAREAGLDPDLVKVNLATHKTESGADYMAVNPKGYVPAVELDNGAILTEVAVILQWIADLVPAARLMPAAGSFERVRAQEWLNFIATELHKAFSPWLWHADTASSTREAVLARLARRFATIEERLGQSAYLAGDSFTIADAYAFVIVGWSSLLKVDLSSFPRLGAYLDRIAARPSVVAAMTAEGLLSKAA